MGLGESGPKAFIHSQTVGAHTPMAPSIFPGAPMIGSYAPGPNPGMRTEILTRLAGNCPPAGTADAVLIFNGDNP